MQNGIHPKRSTILIATAKSLWLSELPIFLQLEIPNIYNSAKTLWLVLAFSRCAITGRNLHSRLENVTVMIRVVIRNHGKKKPTFLPTFISFPPFLLLLIAKISSVHSTSFSPPCAPILPYWGNHLGWSGWVLLKTYLAYMTQPCIVRFMATS